MDIHIGYGVDENYSKYAYISLLSLLKNISWTNNVVCHLISLKNNKYVTHFEKLQDKFDFFRFEYHIIDDKEIKNIPTSLPHLNYSAFFRLKVGEIIKDIDKLLYIDADTIVVWDVTQLYDEDLCNYIVWVVTEWPYISIANLIKEFDLKHWKYFNSWVLLIDLKKRRKFNIWNKTLDMLKKKRYPCDDQTPLNIVLQDNCKWLDWKYNVSTSYFLMNEDNYSNIWFNSDYFDIARKEPTIIHFTWNIKPWHLISIHPYNHVYDNTILRGIKTWNNKIFNYKDYIYTIIHKCIFFLFPTYSLRVKFRNFILKFLK